MSEKNDRSTTEVSELIDRLRSGATPSLDVGVHIRKYQSLCDEAATLLAVQALQINNLTWLLASAKAAAEDDAEDAANRAFFEDPQWPPRSPGRAA